MNAYATNAVIGGLGKFSSKIEVQTWMTNQMWYLSAPEAAEFYVRAEFSGILFAIFPNSAHRVAAACQIRGAQLGFSNLGETRHAHARPGLQHFHLRFEKSHGQLGMGQTCIVG